MHLDTTAAPPAIPDKRTGGANQPKGYAVKTSLLDILAPLWHGWGLIASVACIALGSSVLVALVIGRAVALADRRDPFTRRIPVYPPPVAPSAHYTEDLLDDQPTDVLSDDEITRRFERLVAGL